jgi:hypothetical protein
MVSFRLTEQREGMEESPNHKIGLYTKEPTSTQPHIYTRLMFSPRSEMFRYRVQNMSDSLRSLDMTCSSLVSWAGTKAFPRTTLCLARHFFLCVLCAFSALPAV